MNTAKCNISYEFKSNCFKIKNINGYQIFQSDSLKSIIASLAGDNCFIGTNIPKLPRHRSALCQNLKVKELT